jgi:hypothetical protein
VEANHALLPNPCEPSRDALQRDAQLHGAPRQRLLLQNRWVVQKPASD